MTITSVSSHNLSTAMLPGVLETQSQLTTLQTESTTGQYADLGLQLGGDNGYELSLRANDDLLQTLQTANSGVAARMTSAQTALSSVLSSAQAAAGDVVDWTSGGGSASTLQTIGDSNLQQLIAVGNTTYGDDYLFGGVNTGQAPLDDYFASGGSAAQTAVQTAFQSYFGFSTTSPNVANITTTQLDDFLSGPYASLFASPKWETDWSTASSVNTTSQIAPGDSVTTSTNANEAGFAQLAQGYTMLSAFANIGLSDATERALASNATTNITQAINTVTTAQSTLGFSQADVKQTDDEISSQLTTLQSQIANLDDVNSAQVATQLSSLSTQLEMAYSLTAQINQMNLAQYLPT